VSRQSGSVLDREPSLAEIDFSHALLAGQKKAHWPFVERPPHRWMAVIGECRMQEATVGTA
jgi:hypothetical protein